MMLPYFPQVFDLVSQYGYACDVYLEHVCDYAPTPYAHEHGHAAPFYPKVRACAEDVLMHMAVCMTQCGMLMSVFVLFSQV